MNDDYEFLRKEIEALDELAIYLHNPKGYLFTKQPLEFLIDIAEKSKRITELANEKIVEELKAKNKVLDSELQKLLREVT
jgi:hypothetical protein